MTVPDYERALLALAEYRRMKSADAENQPAYLLELMRTLQDCGYENIDALYEASRRETPVCNRCGQCCLVDGGPCVHLEDNGDGTTTCLRYAERDTACPIGPASDFWCARAIYEAASCQR